MMLSRRVSHLLELWVANDDLTICLFFLLVERNSKVSMAIMGAV